MDRHVDIKKHVLYIHYVTGVRKLAKREQRAFHDESSERRSLKERVMPGCWLGSFIYVSYSALTLLDGWLEGQPCHRKPVPLIAKGSFSRTVGGRGPCGDWLIPVHMETVVQIDTRDAPIRHWPIIWGLLLTWRTADQPSL